MKNKILKKLFILDLILGAILIGVGIYINNNIIIVIGVISFIIGLINPNKIILNKIDKIKGKRK